MTWTGSQTGGEQEEEESSSSPSMERDGRADRTGQDREASPPRSTGLGWAKTGTREGSRCCRMMRSDEAGRSFVSAEAERARPTRVSSGRTPSRDHRPSHRWLAGERAHPRPTNRRERTHHQDGDPCVDTRQRPRSSLDTSPEGGGTSNIRAPQPRLRDRIPQSSSDPTRQQQPVRD